MILPPMILPVSFFALTWPPDSLSCLIRAVRVIRGSVFRLLFSGVPVDVERHNHEQIEMLNQRGGRTLSIVDLVGAGTISVAMAAYAMRAMERGASVLTAARPGAAGKTTLMATLLGFLPPGVRIVTVDSPRAIADGLARPANEPLCYLAHEIGSGHWFGYIWGRDVADFLSLMDGPRRIASCLHADTLDELTDILCSPPLHVPRELLGRVGLILFMHVAPGHRRRVAAFHEADGQGGHRLLFEWDRKIDSFRQTGESADAVELRPYRDFVQRLVEEGDVEVEAVRGKVVEFYRGER